jgi:hypothetical protein
MPSSSQEIAVDRLMLGNPEDEVGFFYGTTVPNGNQVASPGSLYVRTTGGAAATTLYVKVTGVKTNTGWLAVTAA